MRKFILVTAMVLASATAQAGGVRSLTLATAEQPVEQKAVEQKPVQQKTAEQTPGETPKAVAAPVAAEAPKFVARPAPVDTTTAAPQTGTTKPTAETTTETASVEKPKRRGVSIEARVIRELHRHGIYW
jgi:hypothetical protein